MARFARISTNTQDSGQERDRDRRTPMRRSAQSAGEAVAGGNVDQ